MQVILTVAGKMRAN